MRDADRGERRIGGVPSVTTRTPREETGGPAREAFFAVLCRRGLARRHVGLRPRERPARSPSGARRPLVPRPGTCRMLLCSAMETEFTTSRSLGWAASASVPCRSGRVFAHPTWVRRGDAQVGFVLTMEQRV